MKKFMIPLIEVIEVEDDEIITTSGTVRNPDPADFGPGDIENPWPF